ncbi:glycoside hydrolase family 3 [Cohnella kolymensis]|uniref:Glycoside hydrolase family 3 n=1 Tax=Cohnella kolymensis TaxID=1590652 RepID=A0ABR5A4Q9_9BACL|nr:beta-N-acetylhexosaminidase [Cohnella kolymensis]KIL35427.1 glycoside hydrolase family 3 [Cohnella kolymensis]
MNGSVKRYGGTLALALLMVLVSACGWWGSGDPVSAPTASSASHSETPSAPASPPTSESTPPPSVTPSASPTASPTEDEIGGIISGMTLEQKVGQMIIAGIDGTRMDQAAKDMIAEQYIGGIILYKDNFSNLAGSVKLVNDLKKANSGNPAPLFLSVDQEGGKVSRLPKEFAQIPDNRTVASSNNPALAEEMGALLARELKVMGLNVNFAPVLDINSNPKNPVIGRRSFGTDADVVTKMGLAAMKGLSEGGVISVVKHFPGHGDTSVDSHLDLPILFKATEQLQSLEWIPFKAAIEENTDAIMVAHILFPLIDSSAPASLSKVIIGEQLRGTLGYDGVVITDDLTMGAIAKSYGIPQAAAASVEAGTDILLVAHGYDTAKEVYDKLLQSVRNGDIEEARIDESVRRILTLKHKYNLSDEPVAIPTAANLPNDDIISWKKKLGG